MPEVLPYCGAAPLPGELLARFNRDPLLIFALLLATCVSLHRSQGVQHGGALVLAGWAVAAAALISPLRALSVSLFAARVGQHMILLLIAAPLIALGLPQHDRTNLWLPSAIFAALLWFWHMPAPYDATFGSGGIYWAMHVSLFGSAIWLWHALLRQPERKALTVLTAGTFTSMQMSMLGAMLALSGHAMFAPHYFTTQAWGLTPLADQQLGGALMWVPGCLLFVLVGTRGIGQLWRSLEDAKAA